MPELAEVEFYRKQWNPGLKQKIVALKLHATKRIFRGVNTNEMAETLTDATFVASYAHGKQMLFQFSNDAWLGLHLGMSGKLRIEYPDFTSSKHDHLVLRQRAQSLVFNDPRQFGRVLFHLGKDEPLWWKALPPTILSKAFTKDYCEAFVKRHEGAPIKAILLMQEGFPGIGNWMADEILWRSRIAPTTRGTELTSKELKQLWTATKDVCQKALATIGKDFTDPPRSWLFHHRWEKGGNCPRCGSLLQHSTIGGRTTCSCKTCQSGLNPQ